MLSDLHGALSLLEESEELARAARAPNVAICAKTYRSCALALHQVDGAVELMDEAERANGGAATSPRHR